IEFTDNVRGTIALTNGGLMLSADVELNGPGAPLLTISGNDSHRVFNITQGTILVSGLSIAHGLAYDGGGILNAGTLKLQNCSVVSNIAEGLPGGGGIGNYGALLVTHITLA